MRLSVIAGAISLACGPLVLGRPLTTRQFLPTSPPNLLDTPYLLGANSGPNLGAPFYPGSSTSYDDIYPSPESAAPLKLAFSNLDEYGSSVPSAEDPQRVDLSNPVLPSTQNSFGLPSSLYPVIADNSLINSGRSIGSTFRRLMEKKYMYCFYKFEGQDIKTVGCGGEQRSEQEQSARASWGWFVTASNRQDFLGFALYRFDDYKILSIDMVEKKCRKLTSLGDSGYDSYEIYDCGLQQMNFLDGVREAWIQKIKLESAVPNVDPIRADFPP
ncbi:hypothetical protein MMC07_006701 [Pseudocyphellaria aurata]|nr:hypothetical protein [Pseudocyphellaria aurata]